MYIMNLGKPTKVAKLNEAMAIELGANLMGEVIIFSVAGGCLILEYNRQVAKEMKKEEVRLAQVQKFMNDIENLNTITSQQEAEIQYLLEAVKALSKDTKHKLPTNPITTEITKQKKELEPDGKLVSNVNLKTNIETHDRENVKQSLVQRAIIYYQQDVRADRFS